MPFRRVSIPRMSAAPGSLIQIWRIIIALGDLVRSLVVSLAVLRRSALRLRFDRFWNRRCAPLYVSFAPLNTQPPCEILSAPLACRPSMVFNTRSLDACRCWRCREALFRHAAEA